MSVTVSCVSIPYRDLEPNNGDANCLKTFRQEFNTVRYRANAIISNQNLGGLLLIKTMENGSKRAVFTSEAGISFFDFEFSDAGFKVHYITKKLDRKAVIRQLRNDLSMILLHRYEPEECKVLKDSTNQIFLCGDKKDRLAYITDFGCSQLVRIESWHNNKLKTTVSLTSFQNGLPDSVFVDHKNFPFTISLKQIEK